MLHCHYLEKKKHNIVAVVIVSNYSTEVPIILQGNLILQGTIGS